MESTTNQERLKRWREGKGSSPSEPQNQLQLPEEEVASLFEGDFASTEKLSSEESPFGSIAAPSSDDDLAALAANFKEERERKQRRFWMRMALCIFLPSLLLFGYLYAVRSELATAEAAFAVQGANQEGVDLALPGLAASALSGRSMQPAYIAKELLYSAQMMEHLDQEGAFFQAFSDATLDRFSRFIGKGKQRFYRNKIAVSINPIEGIVRMQVKAPTEELALAWSEELLAFTEVEVNELLNEIQRRETATAEEALSLAREELLKAEAKVVELQVRDLDLNPIESASALLSRLASNEQKLTLFRNERAYLLESGLEESPLIDSLAHSVSALKGELDEERRNLFAATGDQTIAERVVEFEHAQMEKELALQRWQSAVKVRELMDLNLMRQQRHLSRIVPPAIAESGHLSSSIRMTVVGAALFSGLYFLGSLFFSYRSSV